MEMVLTSLKRLDINKTTGSDGIPVRLLKETADQIAPPLTMLLNSNLTLHSVRKPANSSALCAELLGTSKVPKRVVHFIFLSSGAISATQPKYGRHSPLAKAS